MDRSLGRKKVPDRLREVHPNVIAHDEVFLQDTDDEVWLSEAGRQRWIVLTKDEKIRRKPGEQLAIARSGARCFVLQVCLSRLPWPTATITSRAWVDSSTTFSAPRSG